LQTFSTGAKRQQGKKTTDVARPTTLVGYQLVDAVFVVPIVLF
jgi:hypothetical protein